MHLRYAQPRIPVYLSRAKDIKDAFKVCPTPDPFLVVEGQRHIRFPGVPRTKSSILLTIRIHQIWWRVTGLPTKLDAFNAIPRRKCSDKRITINGTQDHSAFRECVIDDDTTDKIQCLFISCP
jgi:hypothetical protein